MVVAALSAAGRAAVDVGERAEEVDLAAALDAVSQALPGSRSAPAAVTAAQAWQDQVGGWGRDASDLGADLAGAADDYQDYELFVDGQFRAGAL